MAQSVTPNTRLQVTLTLAASILAGAASGGAGAAVAVVAYRDAERKLVEETIKERERAAQARADLIYLTRSEWASAQASERERLDARLDAIRQELQRLALAVERLRR